MESAGSNAQGLAKSAGASGNHDDGTCSSGPLSTQGFAQSAVDGGDGGIGTHSSVPLPVLLDGGTHDSGVISTAHGFALTSGVTGAGQCSSFYSAQSLVSQSGTASNSAANATTLSLVGGHAGNLWQRCMQRCKCDSTCVAVDETHNYAAFFEVVSSTSS
ncbi:hypothetical protein JKP88DRAFT_241449 [Tribonema minus]|uniref:Uncharacterized protein n=1 Tax=Tribonema minus TaxID=303371 RepID=A0A835Z0A3_9STRA|nr:hypothetical protein JKP88DRAFT_241449 [Tribonema minus]